MNLDYAVMKEKGGQWFCYNVSTKEPVPGSHGDKKKVLHKAAELNGMTLKQFLKERKKEGGD